MSASPAPGPLPGPIVFLGAGNMTEALVKGLIEAKVSPAAAIEVTDPLAARRELFANTYGVRASADNAAAAARAALLVLAVKPQQLDGLLAGLALPQRPLVLSILAGIPTERLEAALGPVPVIRAMPNTPALIGQGAAAVCRGRHATAAHEQMALALLGAVGVVHVVSEAQMDAVTALSGSGPAYVFRLLEAMQAEGTALGLPAAVATDLALATVSGAVALCRATALPPAELRARVSSPGGTTLAALAVLDERGWTEALRAALRAAARRAAELASGPKT